MTYDEILNNAPFDVSQQEKNDIFLKKLREFTVYHKKNCHCPEYHTMLSSVSFDESKVQEVADFPFLLVRLFKELTLKSINDDNIFKVMTSSGTTGQRVSKIYLNRETASNQQKTLVKIVSSFTGSARMPMIIIDCPSVVKNRAMFSARGVGI